MTKNKQVDKFFLIIVFILLTIGVAIFISASLGVYAKNEKLFSSVLISQLVQGLGCGIIALYLCLKIDYKFWRKYSFLIFIGAILLTALVFVPGIGLSHGGALRWLKLGPISFQPVEILKFSFVIYFAAWLSWVKNKVQDFRFGVLPLFMMLGVIALVLLEQPDTKSFILITFTGITMLFISGVPWKYILSVGFISLVLFTGLVLYKPYLQERVKTFINPTTDPQGSGYQIQQSLIALGSGGVFGRGYGQSIQKFGYLPEAQGDSIFAILGEEFGFLGSISVVFLYLLFALRGFRIANNSPDIFSRLLVSGIVIMLSMQSFMHIASVTGVFPLTGVPLPFMSLGGTSLMISLAAIGMVLQISKYNKS